MKRYYVDVENIGQKWIDIVKRRGKEDYILLVTPPGRQLLYSDLIKILDICCTDNIKVKEIFPGCKGDQAADHVILAEANTDSYIFSGDEFVILSNDKGYDVFIESKKADGLKIKRIGTAKDTTEVKQEICTTDDFEGAGLESNAIETETDGRLCRIITAKIIGIVNITCHHPKSIMFDYRLFAEKYISSKYDFKKTLESFPTKDKKKIVCCISKKQIEELKEFADNLNKTGLL